ncbi:MAG: hypothetical protein RQ824_12160 [bacterium]|nr:hypothetical protein [bacterium]
MTTIMHFFKTLFKGKLTTVDIISEINNQLAIGYEDSLRPVKVPVKRPQRSSGRRRRLPLP